MEVIKMLNTDLEVSRVCLGTAYFGTKTSSALSHLILQAYFDNGGNFIDTALQYANWISGENESEKTLGDFLFKNQLRDNVVISTKGFHSSDNGTEQILIDIDKSLANLRTDYIDIYFLHKDHKEFQVSDIIDKLFFAKNDPFWTI
jgi:aryl-alcohol dehydrogenase-like predicted oxidoreductase